MSSIDDHSLGAQKDLVGAQKNLRRSRKRKRLLLLLVAGIVLFGVAGGMLDYALRPITLRIAVGPPGSDDEKLIQVMAKAFAEDIRGIRLAIVQAAGTTESLDILAASKSDLAVARADFDMPSNAETVALIRSNVVVLWAPSGLPTKTSKKQPTQKIQEIADFAGRRVGIIGRSPVNVTLLRLILTAAGVEPEKVAVTQFGTGQIDELARDPTIDVFMALGPLDSKITSEAIASTARTRGPPKFFGIDASEAIALRHPRYESQEIPAGIFRSAPAWPDDKVETVGVDHLIVARKAVSETTVAAFVRNLFILRQSLAKQIPGVSHIKKPNTDKDAEFGASWRCGVHRRHRADVSGQIR